jgi:ribose transport system permease protein
MKVNIRKIYQNSAFPGFIFFICAVTVNIILQPNFFSIKVLQSNLLTFTPIILVSIAQAIIIISGAVDLSIGAGISLITVVMAITMKNSLISIILSVLLVFIVSLAMSSINGFFVSYLKLPSLLMTFATSAIWLGIALVFMPRPGGYIPPVFYKSYSKSLAGFIPVPLIILIGVFILWYFISKSTTHKYIYAVGSNEYSSYASGINVRWTRLKAFMIASIFVSLAGICVVGQTATGDARSGLGFTLNSVAAAIIGGVSLSGGKGNIPGVVMGGLILGILMNIIYFANISTFYQEFIKGAIIILAIAVGMIPKIIKDRTT